MIKKTSFENVSHCALEPNLSLKAAIIHETLKLYICHVELTIHFLLNI